MPIPVVCLRTTNQTLLHSMDLQIISQSAASNVEHIFGILLLGVQHTGPPATGLQPGAMRYGISTSSLIRLLGHFVCHYGKPTPTSGTFFD